MVDHDFLLHPEHWYKRAEETRVKAESLNRDDRHKQQLLRVAAEYERLAERATRWQMMSAAQHQAPGLPSDSG
jgi:hypothetical protein